MGKKKNKKKKHKIKFKYKNIIIFLIIIVLICFFVFNLLYLNLSTTYISGNKILSDDQIIKIAKISKKQSENSIIRIKNELEKNDYILSVSITKTNFFRNTNIKIKENIPLFIYDGKTVLKSGTVIDKKYNVPVVINKIDEGIYSKFLNSMSKVNKNILVHISEIKYDPNDVDKNRFLLSMNDGNYVYVTLTTFTNINEYLKIIKNFENKKGILYLDSGKYFKAIE